MAKKKENTQSSSTTRTRPKLAPGRRRVRIAALRSTSRMLISGWLTSSGQAMSKNSQPDDQHVEQEDDAPVISSSGIPLSAVGVVARCRRSDEACPAAVTRPSFQARQK